MNIHPTLERAEAYVSLHAGHSGPGWTGQPEGPFVTISRESGAGGRSLAYALATRLGHEPGAAEPWTVYDANLIETMLLAHHLPSRFARFLPEDRLSEVNASMGELVGLHPNLWDLVQKTNDLMRKLARQGHAILVGRGANYATATIAHGVHVRLVAPAEYRARYMARLRQISEEEATAANAHRDAARQRYVQSNFNAPVDDPAVYDLVINTGRVPLTEAAELVALLVRTRVPAPA